MSAYSAFDDAHTKTMGDAFDFVCTKLHGVNYPLPVREAIADCIIKTMRVKPDYDSAGLADAVVKTLGIKL